MLRPDLPDATSPALEPPTTDVVQPWHWSRPWQNLRVTLQVKTLLIISLTLLSLILTLYIPLQQILLGGFITLENQLQRTNVERAISVLADTLLALDTLNASYAMWDDTYAFVQHPYEEYIADNWYDDYLLDAQLSLVIITDTAGRVVFSKAYDLVEQRVAEVPLRFRRLGPEDPLLQHVTITSGITGIVLLPDDPMLISARPIVTSQEQGPARGTLIMGRYLDAREVARLAESTHFQLSVHRLDQAATAELRAVYEQLLDGAPILTQTPTATVIEGYTHIPDLDHGDGLILRVDSPRSIYAQGQVSVRSFMGVLLAIGVVFGVAMLTLIDRVVLRPLAALSTRLRQIGRGRNLNARITVSGNNELADLARTVNGMLVALEQAQVEHQQHIAAREEMRLQEETLRTKREFISLVSHELRTPLTPILGYADLLLLDTARLNEEQVISLQTIRQSAIHLSKLVDDLLEIGRLEAKRFSLIKEPLDIRDVAADVAAVFRGELARKQLVLTSELPPDLPLIEADHQRVIQIFTNLLSNAIKYTYPGGQITIRAAQVGADDIEVQISDTGIGITPEQQAQLFMPFYRADHALLRHERGTGLGLSIVRALVDLHGGRVWVRSQPDVGSTFAFILPGQRGAPPPRATMPAEAKDERPDQPAADHPH
jgi:signal transduction histidine kinase